MDEKPRIQPVTRAEWRAWLAANHRSASGVWLVSWKRFFAAGAPSRAMHPVQLAPGES